MRTELYDSSNVLLSRIVNSAVSEPDTIKISKRLLNGEYHNHTVGQHLTKFKITCYTTPANKDRFDNCYVIDEPIRLKKNGINYIGLITEKGEWREVIRNKYFEVSFTLAVKP